MLPGAASDKVLPRPLGFASPLGWSRLAAWQLFPSPLAWPAMLQRGGPQNKLCFVRLAAGIPQCSHSSVEKHTHSISTHKRVIADPGQHSMHIAQRKSPQPMEAHSANSPRAACAPRPRAVAYCACWSKTRHPLCAAA
eukprot:1159221-Pelagomonas_calceolata.AAC.16